MGVLKWFYKTTFGHVYEVQMKHNYFSCLDVGPIPKISYYTCSSIIKSEEVKIWNTSGLNHFRKVIVNLKNVLPQMLKILKLEFIIK
jgi:hypothetical protein